jgi:hypothetical protein
VASIRKQHRYPAHSSFLTDRTGSDIDPTDPEELFLPCLFAGVWFGFGFSVSEDLTTQGDAIFTSSICQQAEVAYSDIASRQDVEKEPSDKLGSLERHGLLTVIVCIISP